MIWKHLNAQICIHFNVLLKCWKVVFCLCRRTMPWGTRQGCRSHVPADTSSPSTRNPSAGGRAPKPRRCWPLNRYGAAATHSLTAFRLNRVLNLLKPLPQMMCLNSINVIFILDFNFDFHWFCFVHFRQLLHLRVKARWCIYRLFDIVSVLLTCNSMNWEILHGYIILLYLIHVQNSVSAQSNLITNYALFWFYECIEHD